MYVANHYVRVNGKMFVAGEVLPEIPEEKAAWLIWAGAIREIKPVPDLTEGTKGDQESDTIGGEPGESTEEDPPESEPGEEAEEGPPESEPGEEAEEGPPESGIDEEAEPEVIDVMAGIVTDTKAPPKPKDRAGKTGGKRGRK